MPRTQLLLMLALLLPLLIGSQPQNMADPDDFFDGLMAEQHTEGFGESRGELLHFSPGFSYSDIGGGTDTSRAVKVTSNGKTVMAGISHNGGNNDFAVSRYHADGSYDTSFHTDGKYTFDFGAEDDRCFGMELDSQGRAVMVGRTDNGVTSRYDWAIARIALDGSLDTSFHTDGKRVWDVSGDADFARAVQIQTDGKIMVGGYTWWMGYYRMIAGRLSSDGSVDNTFGGGGTALGYFGTKDGGALAMLVDLDGRVVLTGTIYSGGTDWDFAVIRFLSDGKYDSAFGTNGTLITDIAGDDDKAYGVAIDTVGSLYLGGSSDNGSNLDFGVVKLLSSGTIDTSFNTTGTARHSITNAQADVAFGVAVQMTALFGQLATRTTARTMTLL